MRGWVRGVVVLAILVAIWAAASEVAHTPLAPGPVAVGRALVAGSRGLMAEWWLSQRAVRSRLLPGLGNRIGMFSCLPSHHLILRVERSCSQMMSLLFGDEVDPAAESAFASFRSGGVVRGSSQRLISA